MRTLGELQLRKWQAEAVKRSQLPPKGIFLEALGGRGKTLCALAICKAKKAKSVIIVNNRLSILKGWEEAIYKFDFDKECAYLTITDRSLQNRLKKGGSLTCDVLIIDEWQNMSSDKIVKSYSKIKRHYTIGLSATPIRKKGQNFYPLEKTLWGYANPPKKYDWQKVHGEMVYDQFAYSKEKWEDFKDYETYISNLPNFMRWEEIEEIENATVNNGYDIRFFKKMIDVANPLALENFRNLNLVVVGEKAVMAKQSFGKQVFERYLMQTGVEIDFPKLKATNIDTPMLLEIDGLIERAPHGMLIVSESKQVVEIIKERNPQLGIWTGERKEDFDNQICVATKQVLGVGVDGLQHRFETIVVLDPVEEGSGKYDDYRQLLWRITGSRQQHDVNVIEFYFKGE